MNIKTTEQQVSQWEAQVKANPPKLIPEFRPRSEMLPCGVNISLDERFGIIKLRVGNHDVAAIDPISFRALLQFAERIGWMADSGSDQ